MVLISWVQVPRKVIVAYLLLRSLHLRLFKHISCYVRTMDTISSQKKKNYGHIFEWARMKQSLHRDLHHIQATFPNNVWHLDEE